MPANEGFAQRAREARRRWALERDAELTYAAIGEQVAAITGRDKAYSHQAVRGWFVEGQEPDFPTVAALARVLGVEAAWLAFGETQHGSPASSARREPMVAPEDGLVPSPRATPGRRRANGSP